MIDLAPKRLVFSSIVALFFLVLAIKLFQLQIHQRQEYFRHSESNRIRRFVLHPDRGLIFDRNCTILVDNSPAYTLYATPYETLGNDSTMERLSQIIGVDTKVLKAELSKAESPFSAVRIRRNIDYATLVSIEEWKLSLPGVFYEIEPKRIYPSPVRAPHLFGYLGEVARAELKSERYAGLRPGDLVGKAGLERLYDQRLRGHLGYDFVEVDALGREVRDIVMDGEIAQVRGEDLHLSLDVRLQAFAEELFVQKRGGLALVDARNGEILALCSKPDYDLDLFSDGISIEEWRHLITADDKPLYDRMVKSSYPPGSTFKLVLAAAALQDGVISPNSRVHCPGFYRLGSRSFSCWNEAGHGTLDLLGAIRESCNTYFYALSLKVDVDRWAEMARKFRFGQPTGIDIPGEAAGLVPDRVYLDKTYGKGGWTRGQMLNLGIGQGDLLTTPLQMAQFAMILGNRGICHQPHLLRAVYRPAEGDTLWIRPQSESLEGISPETLEVLTEGMVQVVNAEGGTGRASAVPGIEVAGKTGTAQNPHGESHAWFIGFAPYERPQVAICVFVENGGGGGGVAAPIAARILRRYFDLYPRQARQKNE
ncbi:penicillin-binding protein 2 [candidate division KSB1 bacterium]|nr:penicillin-binding protein 2 [candidate division KSB1 bacterium]